MIVGIGESWEVACILQIVIAIPPRHGVERRGTCHVRHATCGRNFVGEFPVRMVFPVYIVCIDIFASDIVHLVCLEMMLWTRIDEFAVNGNHILAESSYSALSSS